MNKYCIFYKVYSAKTAMTINFKTELNLVTLKVILYNDMIFLGRKKYNQAKMLIMCIFSDYRATQPVVLQRPAVQHQLACVYH